MNQLILAEKGSIIDVISFINSIFKSFTFEKKLFQEKFKVFHILKNIVKFLF